MSKLSLNLEQLEVASFGTEVPGTELRAGAMAAEAYTLGDHTCRTCRYSICMETSCC